jgi:hypothetical protein
MINERFEMLEHIEELQKENEKLKIEIESLEISLAEKNIDTCWSFGESERIKKEIHQTKALLSEAVEVIEFYGKTERYAFNDVIDGVPECGLIVDDGERINGVGAWIGGKKAREFLAKAKGEKK